MSNTHVMKCVHLTRYVTTRAGAHRNNFYVMSETRTDTAGKCTDLYFKPLDVKIIKSKLVDLLEIGGIILNF
jgi:hypothetical protein